MALLTVIGQWILAGACFSSGYFVLATMFVEYHRKLWRFDGARFRFFRWWRHELTSAQVALDICLFITLLPSMMVTVFNLDFLDLNDHPAAALVYAIAGLASIVVATLWRADATSRAKARERDAVRQPGPPGESATPGHSPAP